MKKLECGTKVLVFHDKDNLLYGEYTLGTIVEYYDEKIIEGDERWYTVRDDHDETIYYPSCLYDEDIITPEDYKNRLVNKVEENNYEIASLLEKNKTFLNQLKTFDENLYVQKFKRKRNIKKIK